MNIDIEKLGYRWKGIYSAALSYVDKDVVFKDGGAYVIRNGVAQPFALGQQDCVLRGHLLTGGVSVGGVGGMTLHSKTGGVEFRFTNERNGTRAIKLAKTYNSGWRAHAGSYTGAAIMNDRTVRVWGMEHNISGINRTFPMLLALPFGVKAEEVYNFYGNLFVIDTDGQLWAAGSSYLGNGVTTGSYVPVNISQGSDIGNNRIVSVHAGGDWYGNYTTAFFAIDTAGRVYGWGLNSSGVLGLGDAVARTRPTLLPWTTTTPIKSAYVSGTNNPWSALIDVEGRLYTAGSDGANFQATNLNTHELYMPFDSGVRVREVGGMESQNHAIPANNRYVNSIVLEDGRMFARQNIADQVGWGGGANNVLYEMSIPDEQVRSALVANGGYLTGFAMTDGNVWYRGYNYENMSPTNANTTTWLPYSLPAGEVPVSIQGGAGNFVRLAYVHTNSGRLYGFGLNAAGQAGIGTTTPNLPTAPRPMVLNNPIIEYQPMGYVANGYGGYSGCTVLDTNGNVYVTGAGLYNMNGDDDAEDTTTPSIIRF